MFWISPFCDIPYDIFYNSSAREWAYLAHCVIGDSAAVLGFVCPSRVMGEDPFWEDIVGAY